MLYKITLFIAVSAILSWIGYTLATTPSPKPIEEIEKELEEAKTEKSEAKEEKKSLNIGIFYNKSNRRIITLSL